MKTLKLAAALVAIALMPALTIAQNKNNSTHNFFNSRGKNSKHAEAVMAKTATTSVIHLHGKSLIYEWNYPNANNWNFNNVEITKYDGKGRLTLLLSVDTLQKDTSSRGSNSYDANGSQFEKEDYKNNGIWQNSYLDTTLLDNKGYTTRQVYYNWDNSANKWSLESDSRIENVTYDGNGNPSTDIEMIYNPNTQKWEKTYEYDITSNTDGSPSSTTDKNWNGSAFVNSQLYNYTWQNWNGYGNYYNGTSTPSKETVKVWRSGSWVDSSSDSYTYDANGGSVDITQIWNGSNWVNAERYSNNFDNKGNYIGNKDENWNGSAWVQSGGENHILTYDANDNITLIIYQHWDNTSNSYVNEEKDVYSDFSTVSGISNSEQSNASLSLYPNPASDNLHLKVNATSSEKVNITIYNLEGQAVITIQHNGNDLSSGISIPVQELHSGMYIVRAVSNSGIELNSKFIKN